jgi:hypothetical protein
VEAEVLQRIRRILSGASQIPVAETLFKRSEHDCTEI